MIRITEKQIKRINLELYTKILNFPTNIILNNFTQKYYNYINDIDNLPKCYCGNVCGFISIKFGYRKFCSTKCASNSLQVKEKIKKTSLNKYGVNRFNNIEKTKQTNLRKYGVNSYTQTNEYLEKTRQTNLKKYGVEHHLKLESQMDKVKKTNLERYGSEFLLNNIVIKNKAKKSNIDKYGTEYPSQSQLTKNKIIENNLIKYGCESTNQIELIKNKKKNTTIKHFGVENPFQNSDIIAKAKKTKLKKYGDENYNNSLKRMKTLMERYGVENPTQYKEFVLKAQDVMIQKYGEIWLKHIPTYNPNSIIFLDIISERLNIPIQHALNGGEKKFIKYWVDGYINEYNICIEWDEKKHYTSKLNKKDVEREKYIIKKFGCSFIRINEREFLKNPENNIKLLIDELEKIKNKYFNIKKGV
jgi:hypothetical protein